MSREVCGDEEDVIRAITNAHFDAGKISAHFLEDECASVNRLSVTDLNESIAIFKRTIENVHTKVRAYAIFGHTNLKTRASEFASQNKQFKKIGYPIQIEKDPRSDNAGHAEIMPRVTRGLANFLSRQPGFFTIDTVV